MRRSLWLWGSLVAAIPCVIALRAWSFPESARETKLPCASCHTNPAGGASLNEPGKAFLADPAKKPETIATRIDFVGSARCKTCHLTQHKGWNGTAHARALASLTKADAKTAAAWAAKLKIELAGPPAESDACVRCHVTGFGLPGGYPATDSVKAAAVAMVGCESCHGPGARHVAAPMADKKKFISRAITAKTCQQCHTAAIHKTFDFAAMKKAGVHALPAASK